MSVLAVTVVPARRRSDRTARASARISPTISRPGPRRSTSSSTATGPAVERLARQYNLVVKRPLTEGRRSSRSTPDSSPRSKPTPRSIICPATFRYRSSAVDGDVRGRSAPTRCGPARTTCPADGPRRHRRGDRLGHRHEASGAQEPVAGVRWTSPAATASTASATARTSRRSSPARPAGRRTRAMYQGVAAGASLVNLRVLGDDGSGTASSVIEAIDWAIEHRRNTTSGVINLSLGAPVLQPYRDDPLCEAAERAVAAGIVVVAAGGNHRARRRTADGCMGGVDVARQRSVGDDGGRARHATARPTRSTTRWRRSARAGRRGTTW